MPGIHRLQRREPNERFSTNGNDENDSSDSRSLVELRSEDFPAYFIERRGRLFASNPTPYLLPVDTPEQERNTFLHHLLHQIHGSNYIGPVPDVLGTDSQVLDVCTGNGIWALEMAREFPQTYFIGFDHVPIATRYPPSNLRFEMEDVNGNYHWPDESFDLVHARGINLAVLDYRSTMERMTRVLRPAGLFISIEWSHSVTLNPRLNHADISIQAPATCRFFNAINQVLRSIRDPYPIEVDVAQLLSDSEAFVDISPTTHYVPIGSWPTDATLREIGEANLRAQERYADSARHLLLDAAWAEGDVQQVVTEYVNELRSVVGLASVCYTVYARKL